MQYFKKAQWIWCAELPETNAYAFFEALFDYIPSNGRAILRISADSQYAVSINGEMVGAGQYADYPEYKIFDEYDVTPFLLEGKNRLHITGYYAGTDSSVYRKGSAGVLFEIIIDGEVIVYSCPDINCAPHRYFRSGEIENVTGQLGYTFHYDANGSPLKFSPAVLVEGAEALYPRPVRRLNVLPRQEGFLQTSGIWQDTEIGTPAYRMQRVPISFRSVQELTNLPVHPSFPQKDGTLFHVEEGDGIYLLFDLRRETAGWIDIELETETGCEVLIGWGEHTDDLRLRTSIGGRNFGARYVARPGRQRFLNPMRRIGLRYIQLFIRARSIRLFYAGILPTVYPVSRTPAFHTADRLHQRIYEVSCDTLVNCMHEHYEDCPWREQALYAMDSRNQMLCGYYAFGEYDMPRESIRLLALGLRDDCLLELCAPARVPITIPSFSAMFVVQLQEYMLFSGDAAFAREMLPTAKTIVEHFLSRCNADGLIPIWEDARYWNFYEWQPYLEGYQKDKKDTESGRVDAPMNCFAILAIARLADLMRMLGEDGSAYLAAADRLRAATHKRFWDDSEGCYYSFANAHDRWHTAELTQALAVCAGVCPEEYIDRVLVRLTDHTLVPITVSYSIFQFDALMTRPEIYSRWVFDHVAEVWGSMLYRNATSFWETIVGAWDFSNAGSLCHGWSAVPIYLYYAYAMGIRPNAPGFRVGSVEPVESGLYERSARILRPNGEIIDF